MFIILESFFKNNFLLNFKLKKIFDKKIIILPNGKSHTEAPSGDQKNNLLFPIYLLYIFYFII